MDATWSVRMPEEMKEKISAMINESDLNSKDFITQVIQTYELKTSKKLQPVMESDIDELTQITGRIHNIFINLCERITNFQRQKDDEFDLKLKQKQEDLTVFNNRIEVYEEKLMKSQDEIKDLEKRFEDTREQYISLNDACEANKALIQEYREKNETLTGLLGEYKEYKSTINDIQKELETEKSIRQSTHLALLEAENEIKQLKTQLMTTKKAFDIELNQKLELSEIQKDKEVLQIRKESQQALESAQKEYAEKTKQLLEVIEKQQISRTVIKPVKKKLRNETSE